MSTRVIRSYQSFTTHRFIHSASTFTTAELDSHADTCAVGSSAYIVHNTGHTVTVHPFTSGLRSLNQVPIVTAAIAYDCPQTLNTYVLFLHQALHIPQLQSHLLCPNQLRSNGITVNDTPLMFINDRERRNTDHAIVAEGMHIPLNLEGVISCFDCRTPTQEEVESEDQSIHIHLTNHHSWDPKDANLTHIEQNLRETVAPVRGQDIGLSDDDFIDLPSYGLSSIEITDDDYVDMPAKTPTEKQLPIFDVRSVAAMGTIQDIEMHRASCALDIDSYSAALAEGRFLDEVLAELPAKDAFYDLDRKIDATYISKKKSMLTADELAKRWKCGRATAQRTIDNTTQLAIRDQSQVSGDRRLNPYANILRYNKLFCPMYVDIMYGRCTSLDGNTMVRKESI